MASPKKTRQSRATNGASKTTARIGKKRRATVIEHYRPYFEKHLSEHLKRNQRRGNRPELIFSSKGIPPEDLSKSSEFESCPVCRNRPFIRNIVARPRLTLTEKVAGKFLRELGFAGDFVENYLKGFREEKTRGKEKRKSAWGLPNIGEFISFEWLLLHGAFPWLTLTATVSILEELLTEKEYTPGQGTIKKRLIKSFNRDLLADILAKRKLSSLLNRILRGDTRTGYGGMWHIASPVSDVLQKRPLKTLRGKGNNNSRCLPVISWKYLGIQFPQNKGPASPLIFCCPVS